MYPTSRSDGAEHGPPAELLLDEDGVEAVWFIRDGHKQLVQPQAIQRSDILRSIICSSTFRDQEAVLPVSHHAMCIWLDHVQDELGCCQTEAIAEDMQKHCSLLLAADVLVDEQTKQQAIRQIRHSLFQGKLTGFHDCESSAATKVLEALTEDLALSVMRSPPRVPLTHLLSHLPASLHPLAVRAHDPCVDAGRSLHLSGLCSASFPIALAAASAFTHITRLSLRAQRVPPGSAGLSHLLSSLPGILSFDLTGSLHATAAGDVAEALAHSPQLTSLDLGSNGLGAGGISALCRAFEALPMLCVLGLRDTACSAEDVRALAQRIGSLSALQSLTVSAPPWRVAAECSFDGRSPALAHAVQALLAQLQPIATLRRLEVSFPTMVCDAATQRGILDAAGRLSQLHSLTLQPPTHSVATQVLHPETCCLSQLTELVLATEPDLQGSGCLSWDNRVLPDIRQMSALQSLHLPRLCDDESEPERLQQIVGALPALSSLTFHIVDAARSQWRPFLQQLPALCCLQRLHVDLEVSDVAADTATALINLAPCVSFSVFFQGGDKAASLQMMLPHMRVLVLCEVPMDEAFAAFVSGMPGLTRLEQLELGLSSDLPPEAAVCRSFCEHLVLLQSLHTLAFCGEVLELLLHGAAEKLPSLQALRSVSFSYVEGHPDLMPILQHACEEHGRIEAFRLCIAVAAPPDCSRLTALEQLDLELLDWPQEQRGGAEPAATTAWDGVAWVAGLQQLARLRRLSIACPAFGEECAAELAAVLGRGGLPGLQVLDLKGCRIGDTEEAAALAAAVPVWVKCRLHSSCFMAM